MQRIFIYKINRNTTIKNYLKYPKNLLTYLKRNQVLVNNQPKRIIDEVKTNDELKIIINEYDDQITPIKHDLDIIYEDEDFLVVNKEANCPIHPDKNYQTNTLANYVAYYLNNHGAYRCITRLDKDTQGLVLLAKNKIAASLLNKQKIHKQYIGLCQGKTKLFGVVNKPILKKENDDYLREVNPKGKKSITIYKRISYNKQENYSKVKFYLITGRTHQIRVHTKYINHPILGDKYYSDNTQFPTQQLYCTYLTFKHPITSKQIKLEHIPNIK